MKKSIRKLKKNSSFVISIFVIWKFGNPGRSKLDHSSMRIGEIASNAEFWMGEPFWNLTIFKVKFWFFKSKKNYINS